MIECPIYDHLHYSLKRMQFSSFLIREKSIYSYITSILKDQGKKCKKSKRGIIILKLFSQLLLKETLSYHPYLLFLKRRFIPILLLKAALSRTPPNSSCMLLGYNYYA